MLEPSLYRFLALMAGLLLMTILRRQQISEELREENNEESQWMSLDFMKRKFGDFGRILQSFE